MSQVLGQQSIKQRYTINSRVVLIAFVSIISLIAGVVGGVLSSRFKSLEKAHNTTVSKEMREIIVAKEGLVFKLGDGTPIATLGLSDYGAYFTIVSKLNKPAVRVADSGGEGVVTIGSSVGTTVYIIAHDEGGGSIVMNGKHGKQVVQLSSFTDEGGGELILSEGSKGNKAVEIGTESIRKNSKGIITIFNGDGTDWQAP